MALSIENILVMLRQGLLKDLTKMVNSLIQLLDWWHYIKARIQKKRRNKYGHNPFMDPSYRNYFYCLTCKILRNPCKALPPFY